MQTLDKIRQQLDKIAYTLSAIVLLCAVIVTMIGHMYKFSEDEAFERLHLETQQIKNNINHQMFSDRENLQTMANFASKLYSDGESFELLLNSFKEIGLFENIGILQPDNSFITKAGILNLNGKISFYDEVQRGEYISGRVKDLTNDEREVVRSAVPVKADDGTVVAIIYGVINLDKLEERYADEAAVINARLCVIEGGSGNYIIDTRYDKLGNVTALASSAYKEGFSYDKMIVDLTEGKEGYAAFMSQNGREYLYSHYAPLDFSDWQIMLSQPEKDVFLGAKATGSYLTLMAMLIISIMLIYIVLVFASERKKLKISSCASNIRKNLLEVNHQMDRIIDALKTITVFAKSRSSFIIDSYNDDYHYIVPSQAGMLISGEERKYFNTRLLTYAARHRTEHGAALYLCEFNVGKRLRAEMPDFYDFVKSHGIKSVHFAVIINNNNNTYVLGVINPRRLYVLELLKEIAVCFSMALYNKKHLAKTEELALTDSLTGVANRMAYKQDMRYAEKTQPFACIYIDVNELHYYNDQNGHAAGDQMLIYIAEVLRKEFSDCRIYRMGGDEFLIFVENLTSDIIESRLVIVNEQIEEMKYHVSIGVKYCDENFDVEETVSAAEKLMYAEKARYYQNKGLKKVTKLANRTIETVQTGNKEIDACLAVMRVRYLGVYCVSHKEDSAIQILAPSYFSEILEQENSFSQSMRKYIHDLVKPEFYRTLLSFLEYDILEKQLKKGQNPIATYIKIDGEGVTLSIHSVAESDNKEIDSIWVFEKEDR